MPNYVRSYLHGGSYFFTVVTHERKPIFDNGCAVGLLRDVVREVRAQMPFTIDAWVVLPNHLHAVWTMPSEDADFSKRWGLIKAGFSKRAGIEGAVWQPRFWEHRIRDDRDFETHINYTYINPVKHGYVESVIDWPWSSFHRDVKRGLYPANWGSNIRVSESQDYGEPSAS
jgi:putative transposase